MTPVTYESGEIINRATKANVVINTIDARGLYVSSVYDASNGRSEANATRTTLVLDEERLRAAVLSDLADGTGGTFFHDRNDIDQGLLQAAMEPEVSYVLGFSPSNLKLNGEYHNLNVTLTKNKEKYTLKARRGYFAPRGAVDPEKAAKQEIQQAVFSHEEIGDLPLNCDTQFSKSPDGVRLTVMAHIMIGGLPFVRAGDRSKDTLTVVTALFDENGKLVTGLQKIITMDLTDAKLEQLNSSGVSVKSDFAVQPGTFLVRIVVRDSDGGQMATTNRGVMIPH